MSYSNARYFIYSIYSIYWIYWIYWVCRYEALLSNPFDENRDENTHENTEERLESGKTRGENLVADKFSLETCFAALLTVYHRLRFYAPCAHRLRRMIESNETATRIARIAIQVRT